MFTATRFVVAGAIVALFGGFLLAGVLTQPSEEAVPAVGATASATTQAEPTATASSGPDLVDNTAEPGTFSPAGTLSTPRFGHTSTLLPDGRVLVVGGTGSGSVDRAEIWDPRSQSFDLTATGVRRDGGGAVTLDDGRVFIAGGDGERTPGMGTTEVWDPATESFDPLGDLFEWRSRPSTSMVRLPDGRVFMAGGSGPYTDTWRRQASSVTEVWDPETGEVTQSDDLPEVRSGQTATLLADGRVLVVGGAGPDFAPTAQAWDPDTESYGAAGALEVPRTAHTATLLDDGRVLVVGGVIDGADGHVAARSAEVWDPESESFRSVGGLATARFAHTATLLPDGRVLIVGGSADAERTGDATPSAEIWDPASEAFVPGGQLDTARVAHTATQMPDGRVLVVGGWDDNGTHASAEIWEPEGWQPPAEPADTSTTPDLLPGVDLVTEEVKPGVYRVLSDGIHDLSEDIWHVAASAGGDVWAEQHGYKLFPATEYTSEDIRSVDSRVFRLGHPEEYVLSRYPDLESEDQEVSLSATGDGLVVVRDLTSDGEEWVLAEGCTGEHGGFTGPDGSCWTVPPSSEVLRRLPGTSPDDDDGHIVYELDELDMTAPAVGLSGWEGWPLIQLAMSGDGTIWATGDMPGTAEAQFSAFDGARWQSIPAMEPVDGLSLEDIHLAIAGGPGATLWVSHWDRAESVLHAWHWDSSGWTAYGPIETFPATARPLDESILWSGLHVSDDGVVWLDGLVRFQGESFQVFEVPASATNVEPRINSITHRSDGSLWMTVVDDAPPEPTVCRSEGWCPPVTDGLYVITPEAVAE